MRPARMVSKWVQLRPWYYTERSPKSRSAEIKEALEQEIEDNDENS